MDINNVNSSRPDGLPRKDSGKVSSPQSGADNSPSPSSSESGVTSVSLSSTVQTLQQLEGQIRSLPEVDIERVEAVKEQLSSGNYQIDAEKVAQKMLDME